MLTRSRKNVAENIQAGKQNKSEAMEKKNPSIPKFRGSGAVTIENFLKIFERKTEEQKEDRPDLILEYLEEEALNYALGQDLYKLPWEEAKTKMIDYFSNRRRTTMQELLQIRLAETSSIEEYYRKMTDAALDLGIQESMILELLINGLTPELKTLNLTRTFESISQWMEVNRALYHHLEKDRKTERKTAPRAAEPENRPEFRIERAPVRRPNQWQHQQQPFRYSYPAETTNRVQHQQPGYQRPWRTHPENNPRGWNYTENYQRPWRAYSRQPPTRQQFPGTQ